MITTLFLYCLHKLKNNLIVKKTNLSILLQTLKRGEKAQQPLFQWLIFGLHASVKEGQFKLDEKEADYPASFCVWDQDQEANPPFGDEREESHVLDRWSEERGKTTVCKLEIMVIAVGHRDAIKLWVFCVFFFILTAYVCCLSLKRSQASCMYVMIG